MIVALHEAPTGFFKTDPPHDNCELLRLVRKAASLGFRAIEMGPLADYASINGERLREVLDELDIKRNVHVGGLFNATKFALTEEEYSRMEEQIRSGMELCSQVDSTSMSIHPPYFPVGNEPTGDVLSMARRRFLKLLKEEVDAAHRYNVKIAVESFCYHPFVFSGIGDFAQFVATFPPEKLGVLLDIGHLYQVGISLSEAVHTFRDKLMDVHVHDALLDGDYRKATHLPIGKGTINFPDLISLLHESRYDGWLTLEIRGSEQQINNGREYLEATMEDLGC
jgi:sugar phosphate isomerase/epimerase